MATITATITPITFAADESHRVTWASMAGATSDVGTAVGHIGEPDRSIQVIGTFNSTVITIQGSNDGGTTWDTLHDPSGTDLTFSARGIKAPLELPQLIRPSAAGGTGSLTVVMSSKRVK